MSRRVPISEAMLETFWRLAPTVLDRYRRDGRADRRETAVLTLLAGLVPVVGLLVLGWAPGTVIACTLVNLALLLVDDLCKAALAAGRWATITEQAAEDDYVWHLGKALLRGNSEVFLEYAGGVQRIKLPVWALWPLSMVSLGVAAFDVLLTVGAGASIPMQAVAWGSLPNALVMLGSYVVGAMVRNPHWRRAGSTRHGSASGSMYGLFMLAFLSLPLILGPVMPDPDHASDESVALLVSVAVVGFGAWRMRGLANCDAVARWLGGGAGRVRRRRAR